MVLIDLIDLFIFISYLCMFTRNNNNVLFLVLKFPGNPTAEKQRFLAFPSSEWKNSCICM